MTSNLIAKYRSKGLLLDTNLLVLFFIGAVDAKNISKNKRTKAYTTDDYELLIGFLKNFQKVVVTSYIVAETSNLVDVFDKKLKSAPFRLMKQFFDNSVFLEEHFPFLEVSNSTLFEQFGATDAGLIEFARENYLILTDDLKLSNHAMSLGVDVINFNHLRDLAWNLN